MASCINNLANVKKSPHVSEIVKYIIEAWTVADILLEIRHGKLSFKSASNLD